jgi:hypothetical protein
MAGGGGGGEGEGAQVCVDKMFFVHYPDNAEKFCIRSHIYSEIYDSRLH